jgi:trehalose 6-phosphate phosphatase
MTKSNLKIVSTSKERSMPASMECDTYELDTTVKLKSVDMQSDFFRSVAAVHQSALLLDFDGTLAPFRVDPSKVQPWAGVTCLLEAIQKSGRTRLVIITGRPARDVEMQLGLRDPLEIWGLHGAERLFPDGRLEVEALPIHQQTALESVRKSIYAAIRELRLGLRVEEKANALAVHWRGKSPHLVQAAQLRLLSLFQPISVEAGMTLLQFDGGIELRAGRNKGDAVRTLLDELSTDTPVAYLGDDATDEDAFRVLGKRGLCVLVRREWRPGAAQLWLRPPAQLRDFLGSWLQAVQR